MRGWQPTLVVNGEAERLAAVRVSWNYFDMMGVRPALGRGFTEAEDHPNTWRVLLLSDRLWRRRFNADPSIVGRTITMNDREYRIVGVMPAAFEPLDAIAVLQRGGRDLGAHRLRAGRRFGVPQLPAPAGVRPAEARRVGCAGDRGDERDPRARCGASIRRTTRKAPSPSCRCATR